MRLLLLDFLIKIKIYGSLFAIQRIFDIRIHIAYSKLFFYRVPAATLVFHLIMILVYDFDSPGKFCFFISDTKIFLFVIE